MMIRIALILVLANTAAIAQQQHQTFRDASGREVGRSVTDARGNTVYRDNMSRNTGSSVTDARDDTTFYDAMGRRTGTARCFPFQRERADRRSS